MRLLKRKYVGIDLGIKGALSVISGNALSLFPFTGNFGESRKRTMSPSELGWLLEDIINSKTYIAIESPMLISPGKKAIASIHKHYGVFQGILRNFPADRLWVPKPNQWKSITQFRGSDKNLMKMYASELFPKVPTINSENADSVLIAHACRLYFND